MTPGYWVNMGTTGQPVLITFPKEERYSEDGAFKVPDEWKGHKVIGIADGEYIETEELVERGNEIEFTAQSIGIRLVGLPSDR